MSDLAKRSANLSLLRLWRRVDSHRHAAFLYILIAMGLFTGQDTISKTLSVDLPPIQIAWVRYAFNVALVTPLIFGTRLRVLTTRQPFTQFLRGTLLAGAAAFFVAGLQFLPIADATAISFVYPILVTLFASLALKEAIGLPRWLAVIAGFLGALTIIRPGAVGVGSAAALPLASAISWSGALLLTRRLAVDAALTTLVYSTLSAALVLTIGTRDGVETYRVASSHSPLLGRANERDGPVWFDPWLLETLRFLPRAAGIHPADLVDDRRLRRLLNLAERKFLAGGCDHCG